MDCVICLDEIVDLNNICMVYYCEHIFHKECFNLLLKSDIKNCPICRNVIHNKIDMSNENEFLKYLKNIDEKKIINSTINKKIDNILKNLQI